MSNRSVVGGRRNVEQGAQLPRAGLVPRPQGRRREHGRGRQGRGGHGPAPGGGRRGRSGGGGRRGGVRAVVRVVIRSIQERRAGQGLGVGRRQVGRQRKAGLARRHWRRPGRSSRRCADRGCLRRRNGAGGSSCSSFLPLLRFGALRFASGLGLGRLGRRFLGSRSRGQWPNSCGCGAGGGGRRGLGLARACPRARRALRAFASRCSSGAGRGHGGGSSARMYKLRGLKVALRIPSACQDRRACVGLGGRRRSVIVKEGHKRAADQVGALAWAPAGLVHCRFSHCYSGHNTGEVEVQGARRRSQRRRKCVHARSAGPTCRSGCAPAARGLGGGQCASQSACVQHDAPFPALCSWQPCCGWRLGAWACGHCRACGEVSRTVLYIHNHDRQHPRAPRPARRLRLVHVVSPAAHRLATACAAAVRRRTRPRTPPAQLGVAT